MAAPALSAFARLRGMPWPVTVEAPHSCDQQPAVRQHEGDDLSRSGLVVGPRPLPYAAVTSVFAKSPPTNSSRA